MIDFTNDIPLEDCVNAWQFSAQKPFTSGKEMHDEYVNAMNMVYTEYQDKLAFCDDPDSLTALFTNFHANAKHLFYDYVKKWGCVRSAGITGWHFDTTAGRNQQILEIEANMQTAGLFQSKFHALVKSFLLIIKKFPEQGQIS